MHERFRESARVRHRLRIPADKGQQSDVVSCPGGRDVRPEQRPEVRRSVPVKQAAGVIGRGEELESAIVKERLLRWQHTFLLVGVGQLPARRPCGLDVGLVEWIDTQHGTRHGGGYLPAEELLADVANIVNADSHDRMAKTMQLLPERFQCPDRPRKQARTKRRYGHPVGLGGCKHLSLDGDYTLSALARGLGNQLFDPCSERSNTGDPTNVSLSRPFRAAAPRISPSRSPGLVWSGAAGEQAPCMACALLSRASTSRPIAAAGTIPKFESAEYLPPIEGMPYMTVPKPRAVALRSSFDPGS